MEQRKREREILKKKRNHSNATFQDAGNRYNTCASLERGKSGFQNGVSSKDLEILDESKQVG